MKPALALAAGIALAATACGPRAAPVQRAFNLDLASEQEAGRFVKEVQARGHYSISSARFSESRTAHHLWKAGLSISVIARPAGTKDQTTDPIPDVSIIADERERNGSLARVEQATALVQGVAVSMGHALRPDQ